jgi:DNA excision repair protein ERCC-2
MRDIGRQNTWCPYFFARHLAKLANVIVFSYQYVIDPKISDLITKEFGGNSILVFDEAHNIGNRLLSCNANKQR